MYSVKISRAKGIIIVLLILATYLSLASSFVTLDKIQDLDRLITYKFPIHGDDSLQYYELAEQLKASQTFSRPETPNVPETFRVPGYPILIAGVISIFKSVWAIVILQIIFVILSAFYIFRITKRFVPEKFAWLPALLFVLDPVVIMNSLSVMTEIFYVLLLLIVIDFLTLSRLPKLGEYALIGLILAITVLVRPVGMYLPIVVLAVLFFKERSLRAEGRSSLACRSLGVGRALRGATLVFPKFFLNSLALVALFFLVLAPWIIRNKIETGVSGISSISAFNLLFYNTSGFLRSEGQIQRSENLGSELGLKNLTEEMDIRNAKAEQNLALKIILSQPVAYGIFHLEGVAHFLIGSSLSAFVDYYVVPIKEWYAENRNNFSGQTIDWLIILERILRIVGLILIPLALVKKDTRSLTWIVLIFALYFALFTGPVSLPRYRIPAEPFLFILALTGLIQIKDRLYERNYR